MQGLFSNGTNAFNGNSTDLFTFGGTGTGSLVTLGSSTVTNVFLRAQSGATITFMGTSVSAGFMGVSSFAAGAGTANFGSYDTFPTFS